MWVLSLPKGHALPSQYANGDLLLTSKMRRFNVLAIIVIAGIGLLYGLVVATSPTDEENLVPLEHSSVTIEQPVVGQTFMTFRAVRPFIMRDVYCVVEGDGTATIEFSMYTLERPTMELGSPATCDKTGVVDQWDASGAIGPSMGAWVPGGFVPRILQRYGIRILTIEGNVVKIDAGFSYEGDATMIETGLEYYEN